MTSYDLIAKKRDGRRHTRQEIAFLVSGFVAGDIDEAQMAAWLMAAYLNGLDSTETLFLTEAMVASGDTVDLRDIAGVKVDKHSTGGVGDKTTLVVVPLAAAVGVKAPKLSGRALGHTGGTLDKLESIPGFRTALTKDEFKRQLNDVGAAIAAQTADLAPADKKIYALRDKTATVASIPLIVASILSKKAAGGAKNILIDVKCGTGAFMTSPDRARELAAALIGVGDFLGLNVACILTDMNQPLGRAVGNALEVKEAIDCLSGGGPQDLRELSVELAAGMVALSGMASSLSAAKEKVEASLDSGAARAKFGQLITAQGGDACVLTEPGRMPAASDRHIVSAKAKGWVSVTDCGRLGLAAAVLSGGHLGDVGPMDRGAGLVMRAKEGEPVESGDPLIELWYSDESRRARAEELLVGALTVVSERPRTRPLIYRTKEKE